MSEANSGTIGVNSGTESVNSGAIVATNTVNSVGTGETMLTYCGVNRLDKLQKSIKNLFTFLEEESKNTGLDKTQGFAKLHHYKVAFNTVVKKKGNEGMEKLSKEWMSLYNRMDTSGVLTEDYLDIGSFWTNESVLYVIFGNGLLATKDKVVNLFFFMKRFLERKEEVEKVLQTSKNDDDEVGDIGAIDRVYELKLRIFRIFRCLCQNEDDIKLILNTIKDLEIRLEVDSDSESQSDNKSMASDPLGGMMNMVSGLFGGLGNSNTNNNGSKGEKPSIPDLSSLTHLFQGNDQLKETIFDTLNKMRECQSGEDLIKTTMGIMTDTDLHQRLSQALPGADMLGSDGSNSEGESSNSGPNPMQLMQSMVSQFLKPKQSGDVDQVPEFDS
jgi:hypothetical protein